MTDYYVDFANGDNSNDGQSTSSAFKDLVPFDPFDGGVNLAGGDSIYLRDTAIIDHPKEVDFRTIQGSSGSPITVTNYQDESPVIDLQNATYDHTGHGIYMLRCQYWDLSNFTVKNAERHNIWIGGDSNGAAEEVSLTNVTSTGAGQGGSTGAGCMVTGANGTTRTVTLTDCKLHHNQGAGGNSDGMAITDDAQSCTVDNCEFYHNGDDGLDLYAADPSNPCTVKNCTSHSNARDDNGNHVGGDGSGYKMGGGAGTGGHTWQDNLSYNNYNSGFNNNQADNPQTIYNCAAYDNGHGNNVNSESGFRMYSDSDTAHELRNCWAYENSGGAIASLPSSGTDDYCSWTLSGVTVGDDDFQSTTASDSNFLNLASGSEMIDAGTDVGLAYNGSDPDLGPYETTPSGGGGVRQTIGGVVQTAGGVIQTVSASTSPTLDSFEDQDLSEYDGETGAFSIKNESNLSFSARDGSYVLENPGTDADSIYSTSITAGKGTTINGWVRATGDNDQLSLCFGLGTGTGDCYEARLEIANNNLVLRDRADGDNMALDLSASIATDTWYRIEIVWDDGTLGGADNDITMRVFDDSDAQQGDTLSANDSTHASQDGIGIIVNGGSSWSAWVDYLYED